MQLPLNYRSFFQEEDEPTRKYWGQEAAGCIFIAKDSGRILLAHRTSDKDERGRDLVKEPGTWGTWGGKVDEGEDPKQAVEREIVEETGYDGPHKISLIHVYKDGNFKYHNYLIIVPFEFTPQLNWENDTSKWVEFGEWPSPLHFGLKSLIHNAGGRIKQVIDLLKKKQGMTFERLDAPDWYKQDQKKRKLMKEESNEVQISKLGIEDIDTYAYEMKSPFSYLRYSYNPPNKIFYLRNIGTPKEENKHKGHATELLEKFFQIIKSYGGALDAEPYTTSGSMYIKHVVERLSKKYNVRLL